MWNLYIFVAYLAPITLKSFTWPDSGRSVAAVAAVVGLATAWHGGAHFQQIKVSMVDGRQ